MKPKLLIVFLMVLLALPYYSFQSRGRNEKLAAAQSALTNEQYETAYRLFSELNDSLLNKGNQSGAVELWKTGYLEALRYNESLRAEEVEKVFEKLKPLAEKASDDLKLIYYKFHADFNAYQALENPTLQEIELSRKLAEKLNQYDDWCFSTHSLAALNFFQGKYSEALKILEEAYKIANEKKDVKESTKNLLLISLTTMYYNTENLPMALKYGKLSLNTLLSASVPDVHKITTAYTNMGAMEKEFGDNISSWNNYYEAYRLIPKISDKEQILDIKLRLATSFQSLGKFSESKKYLQEVIKEKYANSSINYRSIIKQSWHSLGIAYLEENKFDSLKICIEQYEKLPDLSSYEASKTTILWLKALMFESLGNDAKSLEAIKGYAKTAISDYGKKGRIPAETYKNLSRYFLNQKDTTSALSYLQKSISALSFHFDSEDLAANPKSEEMLLYQVTPLVMSQKAKLLFELGKDEWAYQTSKSAIELTELQNRQISHVKEQTRWLETHLNIFETAITLSLRYYEKSKDPKYLDEAVLFVEKSKAMLLLNGLKNQEALNFGEVPDSLANKERKLEVSIAYYEQKATEALRDSMRPDSFLNLAQNEKVALQKLHRTLEDRYPHYFSARFGTKIPTIAELQSKLKSDGCILETFQGNQQVFLFAISRNEVKIKTLPRNETYFDAVENLRTTLSDYNAIIDGKQSFRDFTERAWKVSQILGIPELIATFKDITVLPDGMLAYIPFETLLTEQPHTDQTFASLPYLLNKSDVQYQYSTFLINNPLAAKSNLTNLAGFVPDYRLSEQNNSGKSKLRQGLQNLAGAKKEVNYLHEKHGGITYSDSLATESNFKKTAGDYGIIHAAMHGLIDLEYPERSALIFSDNNEAQEDNFLYSYEISRLNLNASLVVLSACESGYGRYARGEGVLSMGRSFMYAGVPGVVQTLWNIDDQAGADLMPIFYDNLFNGKDIVKSLCDAKRSFIANAKGGRANPIFWSAYTFYGTNSSLPNKRNRWWWYIIGIAGVVIIASYTLRKAQRAG